MSKDLKLKYKTPAERTNDGWERYSLPIGNGYGGASVFGGTDEERLQFTTIRLVRAGCRIFLNCI